MQWELAQIQAVGPNWKEQMIAGTIAGGEGVEGDMGDTGTAAGGIPEFGGGPAAEADVDTDIEATATDDVTPPDAAV